MYGKGRDIAASRFPSLGGVPAGRGGYITQRICDSRRCWHIELETSIHCLILKIVVVGLQQRYVAQRTNNIERSTTHKRISSPRLVTHETFAQFFIKFNDKIFKMNSPSAMLCATNAGGGLPIY
jgi:hypothetical protein